MSEQVVKKASKAEIIEAVNEVIRSYSGKMSLRQIYYRLVSKLIIPNNLNQYKRLSRILVEARENGQVDWRRIEDRARSTSGYDYGHSEQPEKEVYVKDRLKDVFASASFYYPAWKDQPENVEVWIEKDALSRLASNVARNYNVTVCPSKGYSSFTYIMEAVNRIRRYDGQVTILYFGDYDPSGMDITRDLEERLSRYGANVIVERHCLSREQIDEHQLPPFPAKSSDVRYAKFVADTGSTDAVELDALEPPILSQYIKEAIEQHIDWDIWNANKEAGQEIQDEMQGWVDELKDTMIEAFPYLEDNDY